MPNRFAEIAFTATIKRLQEQFGSRKSYERMEDKQEVTNHRLGETESEFIASRNSIYIATVSETGWPYIQHRGGPPGFLRVLDENLIGFADFRGNRQYVSIGNLETNSRIAVFIMDYANKRRLKLYGRARVVGLNDPITLSLLEVPSYRASVERGILIGIEGFDWNCPQHIPERYTPEELVMS